MDVRAVGFDRNHAQVLRACMDFHGAAGLQIRAIFRPGESYPVGGQGVDEFDDGLAHALSTDDDAA